MKKLLLLFTLFFTTSSYASESEMVFLPRASFMFNDPIMGDYGYLGVLGGEAVGSVVHGVSVRAGIGEQAYKANLSYTVNVMLLVGVDVGFSYFQTKNDPHEFLSDKNEGLAFEATFKYMLLDTTITMSKDDYFFRFGFGF